MGINKDQIEGRAKEAGGKIQEELGKLVGNKSQQAKGVLNQAIGAAQATAGDVLQDVRDAANKL
jgi:uncharacterized protein YjbJ (UPF0337 family)